MSRKVVAADYRPVEIAPALRALAGLPTVTLGDGVVVATALDLAERGMDCADALRLATAAHYDGHGQLRPQVHQGDEGGQL